MNASTILQEGNAARSGALHFDGSLITYTSQDYGSFAIPLSEVAVIGEFTNDNGPFADDWFLVFVHRSGKEWFEASIYAEEVESVREQLSSALGSSITLHLATSTDFASCILWPASFAGSPLFILEPVTASRLLGRIKQAISPELSRSLSSEALSAIAS